MDFILGVLIGILFLGIVVLLFSKRFFKNKSEEQSVVLLEKIRNVSKMITVEGDFSEIMHFEDVKGVLLNLVNSKKKAIVLANAKVLIGFDMKKIRLQSKPEKKKLILEHFPEPEILSIETDIQYYDVKHGYFNKFAAKDLSDLNKKVKINIENKIPESELLVSATSKALETVKIIEQMVSTFGWKLDYNGLEFREKAKIEEKL
ncbi:DUF4230 domain-containing protein [Aureibaculum sp. A20]|uniref:DUF4230 domain-containing protein n=1 Tax=Aureibaculum flavum TaxID=2795986 RepID=A0ABS0WN81_9FLAO|nr:DUF4230 domain-containing protein [Aureibaculum flavum]MBJ2173399.1 DUF4230 domain-containing protein [Aureibaculum flavum]